MNPCKCQLLQWGYEKSRSDAFMRTDQIMSLNRGRSKGEDYGHVKSI